MSPKAGATIRRICIEGFVELGEVIEKTRQKSGREAAPVVLEACRGYYRGIQK